jgi:hypothetical protein
MCRADSRASSVSPRDRSADPRRDRRARETASSASQVSFLRGSTVKIGHAQKHEQNPLERSPIAGVGGCGASAVRTGPQKPFQHSKPSMASTGRCSMSAAGSRASRSPPTGRNESRFGISASRRLRQPLGSPIEVPSMPRRREASQFSISPSVSAVGIDHASRKDVEERVQPFRHVSLQVLRIGRSGPGRNRGRNRTAGRESIWAFRSPVGIDAGAVVGSEQEYQPVQHLNLPACSRSDRCRSRHTGRTASPSSISASQPPFGSTPSPLSPSRNRNRNRISMFASKSATIEFSTNLAIVEVTFR